MAYIQKYVPKSSSVRPGTKYKKKYIVIHETGNPSKGANAKAHANLLYREAQQDDGYNVSYNFVVDDKNIYHLIPNDEMTYHSGTKEGNRYGISIEMCVNSDGNYEQTLRNTAELVADLYKENKMWRGDMRQHWHFSKKNCPEIMRGADRWNEFLDMCDKAYDRKYGAGSKPRPQEPINTPKPNNKPTQEEIDEMKAIEKCNELEKIIGTQAQQIAELKNEIAKKENMHTPRYEQASWEVEAIKFMADNGIYKGTVEAEDYNAPLTIGRFLTFGYRIIKFIITRLGGKM